MRRFIEGSSTQIFCGGDPVKTFEFRTTKGPTGLGYYINPKPEVICGILHTSDLYDWYRPFHVPSQSTLGVVFFSESQARRFIRALAPYLDWSQDVEFLQDQENWQTIGKVIYKLRDWSAERR